MAVELREVPVPEIGDDDVLLEVGAVSVCGSDVHQCYDDAFVAGEHPGRRWATSSAAPSPRSGRAVDGFKEGDRVVSETAAVICGTCLMCRTGRYNLCPTRKGFGYGVNGAMAEYVKVPARCLHHVPDSLPFELACLTEPHCVAYNAMCVNATIKPGDSVLVLGPGPDRPAVRAHGGACRRRSRSSSPGSRRRRRAPRDGARARRDAHRQHRRPRASTTSCAASARSAPTWSATRRAPAGRSTSRLKLIAPGRPGHQGRLVARPGARSTSIRWCRRTSGCRARSATTFRSGSGSSTCWTGG